MDFATVASFIALQVASGFLKEHGKEIYEKVKSLLTPGELISLNLLEAHSDDKDLLSQVSSAVERYFEINPDIARELERLIASLPVSETIQHTITQTGDGNVAMQDVHESKININK